MDALKEVAVYLLNTLGSLYMMVVIVRFLLQLARADFYNPISQFVVKATNPLVLPLRRVIPGFGGFDWATLLVALLLQALLISLILGFNGRLDLLSVSLVAWSLIGLAAAITKLFFFTIIVSIVFSWIAPGSNHPVLALLHQINEPMLSPLRRLLPAMGGLDLSPILAFLMINVIDILLRHAAVATHMPLRPLFM